MKSQQVKEELALVGLEVQFALAVPGRVQQGADHLVLLVEPRHRLCCRDHRIVDLRLVVGLKRGAQVLADPDVVDDESTGLVTEDAVDPGDRLQQPVIAHWLVDVEGVESGSIKARQPHVLDDDNPQRVVRIAEALGEFLELCF